MRYDKVTSSLCFSGLVLMVGIFVCKSEVANKNVAKRTEIVRVDGQGFKSVCTLQEKPKYGTFEVKVFDKNGKLTQWYQHFDDSYGREILSVVRSPVISGTTSDSIISLIAYSYNSSGNVSEEYQLLGDGSFRSHVIYRYGWLGGFLRGDAYDSEGKFIESINEIPEGHLYGSK